MGERSVILDKSYFKREANGTYRVDFNGVFATQFNETVEARFLRDGVEIGQYATYSVNSYLYTNQANPDAILAALVKATYNYGLSARLYAGLGDYSIEVEPEIPTPPTPDTPEVEEGYMPTGKDEEKDDLDWDLL